MKIIPVLMMKIQKIQYGKKCIFFGLPIIYKDKKSKIVIGDRCRFRSGVLTNLIGLYQRTIIVAKKGAEVNLGSNIGASGITIYARKGISIGENTLIGANTKILDNDFHPIDEKARMVNDVSKVKSEKIVIGKNCFIGCNSIILKGTILGDNCVVGAGAVVSGKFEKNSVIAGNPAKVIKNSI